jgi:hypothetical protein
LVLARFVRESSFVDDKRGEVRREEGHAGSF